MARKMKKVDWERFWAKFDKWCQLKDKICPKYITCRETDYPDWSEQRKKIQQLFEKYVLK